MILKNVILVLKIDTCFLITVGACGYGNLSEQGYGLETAALTTALFGNGATCGACYELRCIDSAWCKSGASSIRITATNFCPLNYTKTERSLVQPAAKTFRPLHANVPKDCRI